MKPVFYMAIIVFIFSLSHSFALHAEERSSATSTKTCQLKIEGMTCLSCAWHVKEALKDICSAVTVDNKSGRGSCSYDSTQTTPDHIAKRVSEAGYKAEIVE